MASCRECAQPITWQQVDGRWKAMQPPLLEQEHFMVCPSPDALRRRIRMGLEPNVFPVSMSRLSLYRKCPRAYQRRYVDHIPEPTTPPQIMGQEFHRYVAAWLQELPRPEITIPLEEAAAFNRMVEAFDNAEWKNPDIAGIEERVVYEWQDEAVTVNFEGIVDMLTIKGSSAVITDWKTGYDVPSEAQLRDDLQGQAYALLLYRHYPQLRHIRFQQVHFRFGARVVGVEYEIDQLEAFDGALKSEVAKLIREVDFRPSPACEICPPGAHEDLALDLYRDVKVVTATGDVTMTIAPIENQEQAEKLARGARFADVIAKACKDKLRDWTRDNGPALVTAGGGYGHFAQVTRTVTDIEKAIAILKDAGLDPNDYVRLDMTAAKPLLGTSRRSIPELHELIESSIGTKFEWKAKALVEEDAA